MKTKKISILIIVCLLLTCLTACNPNPLDAPTNVQIEDETVTWNAVDGAKSYTIVIDGKEKETVNNTYFDLSKLALTEGKEYTIQVKANGDGYLKTKSGLSQAVTYIVPKSEVPPEITVNRMLMSRAEKENYLTGSSKSYYGVGRAINVITDEYIDVDTRYAKVFDDSKLLDLNWYTSFIGKMSSSNVQGASMREFYSNMNVEFNSALSAKAEVSIFSAGIDTSFGFSAGSQYKSVANEVYHQAYQSYASHLVEIDERLNLSQFQSTLKQSVLEDARNLAPADFMNKYGTHTILAANYGGKIEYGYYLGNNGKKWDASTSLKYASNLSAGFGKLAQASAGSNFSILSQVGCNASETIGKFYANAVGGAAFKAINENDFLANYGDWVDSMNGKSVENSTIVSLPTKSLVAIWDLFPKEYNAEKTKLATYFEQYANKVSSEFLSKFNRNPATEIPSVSNTYSVVVRNENKEAKVTQGYDIYDLFELPFNYSKLNASDGQPYKTVFIKVEFQLKETGTCYQHVDLLDGNKNAIIEKTFEQGGNNMNPYNKYEPFEYTYETSIDSLKNRYPGGLRFYLKYHANGNGWDLNEFYIKDVKVTFTFGK